MTSYYLPTVLIESVGLSNTLARLLAACNSVSYLLFSLIGIPNVERWGRRKMMMYAAAGQFFCYCIITVCIRYNEDTSLSPARNTQWAKGSIAFFFLYYVFFGIGWQGVPWVSSLLHYFRAACSLIIAISDRNQLHGNANKRRCSRHSHQLVSLSAADLAAPTHQAHRIFNFMVVEITPPGIRSLGWRFYIIWCVFNFAFIPTGKPNPRLFIPTAHSTAVYFFYPETAGRTLEDLDRYFAGDAPLLVFRDKEVISSKRPQQYIENEKAEVRRHSSVAVGDVQAANAAYARKSQAEGAEYQDHV